MPKLLPALLLLFPLAAQAAPADVVARAGSLSMTAADVANLVGSLDAATRARVLASPNGIDELVRDRLTTQALLAEANGKNWASRPDVATRIAQARDGVILQTYLASVGKPDPAYPTDALVQTTYDANKSQFVIPRQYHLAQLVLPLSPKDKDAGARAAADLRRRAAGGDRGFAAASHAPGVTETDLGWIGENRLQPAIRDAVAGLPEGGVSDPVRLADGFHLFRLVATKPAGTAPLEAVRPQIVAALQRQQADRNARAYIASLQGRLHVQLNEIALSAAVPK